MAGNPSPEKDTDPSAALRTLLVARREEIIEAMVRDGFSAGLGALLVYLGAALDAPTRRKETRQRTRTAQDREHQKIPPRAPCAAGTQRWRRPGRHPAGGPDVRLILFDGARRLGKAELDAVGMIVLAAELCPAGGRRLARTFP